MLEPSIIKTLKWSGNGGGGQLLIVSKLEKVQPSLEEKVFCWQERSGLFSVKSLFEALEPEPSYSFPTNIIWRSKVQPRGCFFSRKAEWGKV